MLKKDTIFCRKNPLRKYEMVGICAERATSGLSQESDVCENCFGRSLPVAEIDRPLMVAGAVLVQANEQLEDVIPTGDAQVACVSVVSG